MPQTLDTDHYSGPSTNGQASTWERVSNNNPCPICGHDHWCSVSGDVIHCMRVESDHPASDGGWIHGTSRRSLTAEEREDREREDYLEMRRMRLAIQEVRDRYRQIKRCPNDKIIQLAEELGVSKESLINLGIGWWGLYTFPMQDGNRNLTGYATRKPDGRKACIPGSNVGLYIPRDLMIRDKLYICEGLSDTAVAWDMGLPAIGRHNCLSGVDEIKQLVGGTDIDLTVISDNDESMVGMKGAQRLAKALDGRLIAPPAEYKDLREWFNAGGTDRAWLGRTVLARRLQVGNLEEVERRFPFIATQTTQELLADQTRTNYLIDDILVEGQPMIMGGRAKVLKTSIGVDMAIIWSQRRNVILRCSAFLSLIVSVARWCSEPRVQPRSRTASWPSSASGGNLHGC